MINLVNYLTENTDKRSSARNGVKGREQPEEDMKLRVSVGAECIREWLGVNVDANGRAFLTI
jgi:hypothetical protein